MKNKKHTLKKEISEKRAGNEAPTFDAGSFADFCIVGGGAAGLVAGISYLRNKPNANVYILEKNEKVGRKIYATGNGKCNLSNTACENHEEMRRFFESIGVWTKTDEAGRMYPQSEAAADVVHALVLELTRLGAKMVCSCEVTGIETTSEGFTVVVNGSRLSAKSVLLATGGKAGPQFGCMGAGYRFAKSLGLAVTSVYPALSGIELLHAELKDSSEAMPFSVLRGTRLKGKVSLLLGEKVIAASEGEIQCNDYGVSGICMMDLSSSIRLSEERSFSDYRLCIMPEIAEAIVKGDVSLEERAKVSGLLAGDLLLSLLPEKAAKYLLAKAGIPSEDPASEVADRMGMLKDLLTGGWYETVAGVRGWKQAQCTGGGIELSQIDEKMAVKRIPGLFAAGEVLDYVGPCGGFNLNYAFSTGLLAGKAAADVSNPSD